MKQIWNKKITVGKYTISDNQPCFVIAEAGVNHNGKMAIAKKLVEAANDSEANAIKFQTYKTSKLVSKKLLPQMYNMLKKYEFEDEDFAELRDYSKSQGIIFCSTPFDIQSCDLLDRLRVPFYKIGSGDLDNIPLIMHAAKKKIPVLLSTGMSSNEEIRNALNSIRSYNDKIVLMHCTSIYPAEFSEAHLNVIPTMNHDYDILIGYSDHTIGYEASLAACCFGACVIEKHLTLDNKMPGPDHKASLDPKIFKKMIESIRHIEESFGDDKKRILERERKTRRVARRSIIAVKDIPKGKLIDPNDIEILRPYGGMNPRYFERVLGRRAKINIKKDSMLQWNMLK